MPDDPYKDFAESYDLFFKDISEHSNAEKEFFNTLFNDSKVKTVLDCACGTGHDLIMFYEMGFHVTGSDISQSMLAQARKNLAKHCRVVQIHNIDYRQLHKHFDSKFDAVVCLSSSILHMPDDAEVIRAFKSMRDVLTDKGILVLTQGTSDKQWNEKPRFIPTINTKDFTRFFVIDYIDKGARYNIVDINHSDEKTDFKVWGVDYPNMLLKDDYKRLLKKSGFGKTDFYGSFDLESYSIKTSNRLIIVAFK